jgi:hypothetical protein
VRFIVENSYKPELTAALSSLPTARTKYAQCPPCGGRCDGLSSTDGSCRVDKCRLRDRIAVRPTTELGVLLAVYRDQLTWSVGEHDVALEYTGRG